ncbi:hypothetical protein TrST_g9643 [Triparma strigata]|uniref:Uncharacterized protein n=1 Tax=Triparma strigata TaxID=1606541 RepID=A0A9W6ZQK5_9STRA|nr:hypothetical protein TrST_g9643 [Triparma strigata]
MTERFAGPSKRMIAPPGGATQTVQYAPSREILDSKRIPLMEDQETELSSQLIVLDEGTRARNREFKRRMDAVQSRQETWNERLNEEEEERDKEHDQVMKEVERQFNEAVESIWDKIDVDFRVFHEVHIPPHEDRMTYLEKDFDHFVNVTVPKAIDECSEIIARKVVKAREYFEIENTKVLKREEKIVERFEKHVGRTTQGFEDEEATRIAKLRLLTEEIDAPERVDERLEEVKITKVFREITKIRERIKQEEEERAVEDGLVLDEMLRTQEKLQQSVLENFGAE